MKRCSTSLIIREMQIKITWDITLHLSECHNTQEITVNLTKSKQCARAFEMVMCAKDNVYHLDCFAYKFFPKNNMILCQTDYEGLMKEGYAPQVR
ncbi:unnamed protein product [Nyctereutes procyonoides]|uniref:(raccoon dog) hypothetical protein n=1 Tax=Nyctereutes procyonoides TaxID=34880 RepID=A0A811ZRX1_NYCPR|nr:unnamed protein product [Nyctereutes procyonoides]